MKFYFVEYFILFTYIIISFILACIISLLSYLLTTKKEDPEKTSAYECGFNPFDDTRTTFDVKFYLVAILFFNFCLEISFLFPWSIVLGNISYFGFVAIILFLFILTIGFIYEWKKGALNW
uniref:NADH-ubiquinone oxidoreductase chain 3 n=1 Tax=Cyanidium caldarium TaxID=2771 RepID=NU3M_CYACA|nr:RecName: Full=NADH-ubiquinone oxidoreductase chain 3; AltName: Full=NADH dehydrogenase subunit 3 [Cyanidium caldarium]CAA88774.1 NADH dehydrogenase subunit 3 [Cyanidium caldarium]